MDEDHVWCASAAPWLLFPREQLPDSVPILRDDVEAGDCSVVDGHGEVASTDIRWFGDSETCEGLRVFGAEGAGAFHVACAGEGDTGQVDPHSTPFRFEVGTDPCLSGDLEGTMLVAEEYAWNKWEVDFSPQFEVGEFYAAGGLIREITPTKDILGVHGPGSLEKHCKNIGPTLSLQLLQPDGSESEVVELEMPCDVLETGCASAGRGAPAWIALLGLPLALARRARRP
jgi:uncharacterized protein (TIGR03382 family)